MTTDLTIRCERPDDAAVIAATVAAAFGREAEAALVAALRDLDQLTVSLAAVLDDRIVGHVALSPVAVDERSGDGHWLGLGPLAVQRGLQRQGIGRRLVDEAVATAAASGASAVFVLGNSSYYGALGFEAATDFGCRCVYDVPPAAFRVRRLGEPGNWPPPGTVTYHGAFAAL
ncbi:MAG: GNAT family N-acetyltransferase [Geminicoccaceae bacterium]|jgi:putative acetyltransferase